MRPPLELLQGPLHVGAETAIDAGVREAVPCESELQLGDVPAAHPPREWPRAKHVRSEAAEGATRFRAGDAVRRQAVPSLEALDRRSRPRARHSVDRAAVDAVVAQRHLQRRHGGPAGCAHGLRGEQRARDKGDEDPDEAGASHHSNEGSAVSANSLALGAYALPEWVPASDGALLPRL